MTDSSGGTPPFSIPGFPGFGQADMMGKMWKLMRLNPFTAAMQGGAHGANPSLSMMSDMLAPLTNIEELDKRVTDMRAVEHWLKLNLNMLQSAIQALKVQRATLAKLRASSGVRTAVSYVNRPLQQYIRTGKCSVFAGRDALPQRQNAALRCPIRSMTVGIPRKIESLVARVQQFLARPGRSPRSSSIQN